MSEFESGSKQHTSSATHAAPPLFAETPNVESLGYLSAKFAHSTTSSEEPKALSEADELRSKPMTDSTGSIEVVETPVLIDKSADDFENDPPPVSSALLSTDDAGGSHDSSLSEPVDLAAESEEAGMLSLDYLSRISSDLGLPSLMSSLLTTTDSTTAALSSTVARGVGGGDIDSVSYAQALSHDFSVRSGHPLIVDYDRSERSSLSPKPKEMSADHSSSVGEASSLVSASSLLNEQQKQPERVDCHSRPQHRAYDDEWVMKSSVFVLDEEMIEIDTSPEVSAVSSTALADDLGSRSVSEERVTEERGIDSGSSGVISSVVPSVHTPEELGRSYEVLSKSTPDLKILDMSPIVKPVGFDSGKIGDAIHTEDLSKSSVMVRGHHPKIADGSPLTAVSMASSVGGTTVSGSFVRSMEASPCVVARPAEGVTVIADEDEEDEDADDKDKGAMSAADDDPALPMPDLILNHVETRPRKDAEDFVPFRSKSDQSVQDSQSSLIPVLTSLARTPSSSAKLDAYYRPQFIRIDRSDDASTLISSAVDDHKPVSDVGTSLLSATSASKPSISSSSARDTTTAVTVHRRRGTSTMDDSEKDVKTTPGSWLMHARHRIYTMVGSSQYYSSLTSVYSRRGTKHSFVRGTPVFILGDEYSFSPEYHQCKGETFRGIARSQEKSAIYAAGDSAGVGDGDCESEEKIEMMMDSVSSSAEIDSGGVSTTHSPKRPMSSLSKRMQRRRKKKKMKLSKSHLKKDMSKSPVMQELLSSIYSKVWITYRKDYKAIFDSGYTSDAGWGCMLRTTQMMFAQCLICFYLGRRWTVTRPSVRPLPPESSSSSLSSSSSNQSSKREFHSTLSDYATDKELFQMIVSMFSEPAPMLIADEDNNHDNTNDDTVSSVASVTGDDSGGGVVAGADHHHHYIPPPQSSSNLISLCKRISRMGGGPFSIHRMLFHGLVYRKPIGTWFGPTEACYTLSQCCNLDCDFFFDHRNPQSKQQTDSGTVRMGDDSLLGDSDDHHHTSTVHPSNEYRSTENAIFALPRSRDGYGLVCLTATNSSGVLYKDEILELCRDPYTQEWVNSICVFLPLRLGLQTTINDPSHYRGIIHCLTMFNCLGIVGGQPQRSLYFFGAQGTRLFYLDPHTVFPFNSFSQHCRDINSVEVGELDPSMAVGFFIRDEIDLAHFWVECIQMMSDMPDSCVFTVQESRPPVYDFTRDDSSHGASDEDLSDDWEKL